MSGSNTNNNNNNSEKGFVFPVGAAGKRELKRELRQATDPERTIQEFQKNHSLHFMMAKAFGTIPIHEYNQNKKNGSKSTGTTTRSTTKPQGSSGVVGIVESLDTDSVMTFLSYLGVRQFEVHKRISDTLLKQLEDDIRKTKAANEESLLDLLRESWPYAVSLPELRPIIWSVLKQLGEKTPHAVLQALAERDDTDGSLKHADIFRPLPALLKKLVWEGDWETRFPEHQMEASDQPPQAFLQDCEKTLLYETIYPLVEQYCNNAILCELANRPFVPSIRERRVLTTQRRALTTTSSSSSSTTTLLEKGPSSTTTGGLLASGAVGAVTTATNNNASQQQQQQDNQSSSKAVAHLRVFLSNSGGAAGAGSATTTALSFRPKLLYALLQMLIARHGIQPTPYMAGAQHLHCTLVSDILLSSGGPLPKAYHHVHQLARIIDECVQEGSISNDAIKNIQNALKEIFAADLDASSSVDATTAAAAKKEQPGSTTAKTTPKAATGGGGGKDDAQHAIKEEIMMTNALQRQLNQIITAGIAALKESDPQSLFLNPVTDKIAPGYSNIIKQPICILDMVQKIDENQYKAVNEWKQEVELMYKNCHDYNKGKAGQWFRGEALRQRKIFEEEIYPQARKLYETELAKRVGEEEDRKRKAMADRPDIMPLEKATKKKQRTKKEKSQQQQQPGGGAGGGGDEILAMTPSIPSLAFMILSDPFFVRIVMDRVLRESRVSITQQAGGGGCTIPAASFIIPSLLQFLHMTRWSTQICSIRAKRYFVPSGGLTLGGGSSGRSSHDDAAEGSMNADPAVLVPYATLRQDLPLIIRLWLEADLDKRLVSPNGDLHDAAAAAEEGDEEQSSFWKLEPITAQEWGAQQRQGQQQFLEVSISLMEGAIIQLCQPGNTTEASLAITFPKFALALIHISSSSQQENSVFINDRPFFQCLIRAIIRHKTKLSKAARDAIVKSWLLWLTPPIMTTTTNKKKKKNNKKMAPHDDDDEGDGGGSLSTAWGEDQPLVSAAHECLIQLLNEWSSIGNQILPRDTLRSFVADTVKTVTLKRRLSLKKKETMDVDDDENDDENNQGIARFAELWNQTTMMEEEEDGEMKGDDKNKNNSDQHSSRTTTLGSREASFVPVKKQYIQMLKNLPANIALQWKEEMGIVSRQKTAAAAAAADEPPGEDDAAQGEVEEEESSNDNSSHNMEEGVNEGEEEEDGAGGFED